MSDRPEDQNPALPDPNGPPPAVEDSQLESTSGKFFEKHFPHLKGAVDNKVFLDQLNKGIDSASDYLEGILGKPLPKVAKDDLKALVLEVRNATRKNAEALKAVEDRLGKQQREYTALLSTLQSRSDTRTDELEKLLIEALTLLRSVQASTAGQEPSQTQKSLYQGEEFSKLLDVSNRINIESQKPAVAQAMPPGSQGGIPPLGPAIASDVRARVPNIDRAMSGSLAGIFHQAHSAQGLPGQAVHQGMRRLAYGINPGIGLLADLMGGGQGVLRRGANFLSNYRANRELDAYEAEREGGEPETGMAYSVFRAFMGGDPYRSSPWNRFNVRTRARHLQRIRDHEERDERDRKRIRKGDGERVDAADVGELRVSEDRPEAQRSRATAQATQLSSRVQGTVTATPTSPPPSVTVPQEETPPPTPAKIVQEQPSRPTPQDQRLSDPSKHISPLWDVLHNPVLSTTANLHQSKGLASQATHHGMRRLAYGINPAVGLLMDMTGGGHNVLRRASNFITNYRGHRALDEVEGKESSFGRTVLSSLLGGDPYSTTKHNPFSLYGREVDIKRRYEQQKKNDRDLVAIARKAEQDRKRAEREGKQETQPETVTGSVGVSAATQTVLDATRATQPTSAPEAVQETPSGQQHGFWDKVRESDASELRRVSNLLMVASSQREAGKLTAPEQFDRFVQEYSQRTSLPPSAKSTPSATARFDPGQMSVPAQTLSAIPPSQISQTVSAVPSNEAQPLRLDAQILLGPPPRIRTVEEIRREDRVTAEKARRINEQEVMRFADYQQQKREIEHVGAQPPVSPTPARPAAPKAESPPRIRTIEEIVREDRTTPSQARKVNEQEVLRYADYQQQQRERKKVEAQAPSEPVRAASTTAQQTRAGLSTETAETLVSGHPAEDRTPSQAQTRVEETKEAQDYFKRSLDFFDRIVQTLVRIEADTKASGERSTEAPSSPVTRGRAGSVPTISGSSAPPGMFQGMPRPGIQGAVGYAGVPRYPGAFGTLNPLGTGPLLSGTSPAATALQDTVKTQMAHTAGDVETVPERTEREVRSEEVHAEQYYTKSLHLLDEILKELKKLSGDDAEGQATGHGTSPQGQGSGGFLKNLLEGAVELAVGRRLSKMFLGGGRKALGGLRDLFKKGAGAAAGEEAAELGESLEGSVPRETPRGSKPAPREVVPEEAKSTPRPSSVPETPRSSTARPSSVPATEDAGSGLRGLGEATKGFGRAAVEGVEGAAGAAGALGTFPMLGIGLGVAGLAGMAAYGTYKSQKDIAEHGAIGEVPLAVDDFGNPIGYRKATPAELGQNPKPSAPPVVQKQKEPAKAPTKTDGSRVVAWLGRKLGFSSAQAEEVVTSTPDVEPGIAPSAFGRVAETSPRSPGANVSAAPQPASTAQTTIVAATTAAVSGVAQPTTTSPTISATAPAAAPDALHEQTADTKKADTQEEKANKEKSDNNKKLDALVGDMSLEAGGGLLAESAEGAGLLSTLFKGMRDKGEDIGKSGIRGPKTAQQLRDEAEKTKREQRSSQTSITGTIQQTTPAPTVSATALPLSPDAIQEHSADTQKADTQENKAEQKKNENDSKLSALIDRVSKAASFVPGFGEVQVLGSLFQGIRKAGPEVGRRGIRGPKTAQQLRDEADKMEQEKGLGRVPALGPDADLMRRGQDNQGRVQPYNDQGRAPPRVPSESGETPRAATSSQTFQQNAPRLMSDIMRDYSLNKEQAAAIVGNLAHESAGLHPGIQEQNPRSGRGGLGFAQWTGERRDEFLRYAEENKLSPTSYEANYGFFKHETQDGKYTSAIEHLRQTKPGDLQGAVVQFEKDYEKAGVKSYSSRLAYAQGALSSLDVIEGEPGKRTRDDGSRVTASLDSPRAPGLAADILRQRATNPGDLPAGVQVASADARFVPTISGLSPPHAPPTVDTSMLGRGVSQATGQIPQGIGSAISGIVGGLFSRGAGVVSRALGGALSHEAKMLPQALRPLAGQAEGAIERGLGVSPQGVVGAAHGITDRLINNVIGHPSPRLSSPQTASVYGSPGQRTSRSAISEISGRSSRAHGEMDTASLGVPTTTPTGSESSALSMIEAIQQSGGTGDSNDQGRSNNVATGSPTINGSASSLMDINNAFAPDETQLFAIQRLG